MYLSQKVIVTIIYSALFRCYIFSLKWVSQFLKKSAFKFLSIQCLKFSLSSVRGNSSIKKDYIQLHIKCYFKIHISSHCNVLLEPPCLQLAFSQILLKFHVLINAYTWQQGRDRMQKLKRGSLQYNFILSLLTILKTIFKLHLLCSLTFMWNKI